MKKTNTKSAKQKADRKPTAAAVIPAKAAKPAKGNDWESFTDAELAKAVELMIRPDDLTIRGAALALLKTFDLTPEDVRAQLESGEYFNNGACFCELTSTFPRIVWNNGTLRPDEIDSYKGTEADDGTAFCV